MTIGQYIREILIATVSMCLAYLFQRAIERHDQRRSDARRTS